MKRFLACLLILSSTLYFYSCASNPKKETDLTEDDEWVEESDLAEDENSALPVEELGTNADDESGEQIDEPDSLSKTEGEKIDDFLSKSEEAQTGTLLIPSSKYRAYTNKSFNYMAAIPNNWYISEAVIGNSGVTRIKRNSSQITVTTYKPGEKNLSHYLDMARHKIKKSDAAFSTIIEEKSLTTQAGYNASLMVHEYKRKGTKYLRRTLVVKQNGNAHVISCEAPLSKFYSTEDNFNTFMISFKPANL